MIEMLRQIKQKKLACDLGDPSDGLHDPPLETINWNIAKCYKVSGYHRW